MRNNLRVKSAVTICFTALLSVLCVTCAALHIFGYTLVPSKGAICSAIVLVAVPGIYTVFFNERKRLGMSFAVVALVFVNAFNCLTSRADIYMNGIIEYHVILFSTAMLIIGLLIIRQGKRSLREFGIFLTVLFIVLLLFFILLFNFLSNMSVNEISDESDSPNGEYCVMVVRNDQGAMGGITHVYTVKKAEPIDTVFGKLIMTPKNILTCGWGETLDIVWKNDTTAEINGVEYSIQNELS